MKQSSDITYTPFIPVTTATIINGVKVWDRRWWANILCKINLCLHPSKRRMIKKFQNMVVSTSHYQIAS
jgi:hypothetical protein